MPNVKQAWRDLDADLVRVVTPDAEVIEVRVREVPVGEDRRAALAARGFVVNEDLALPPEPSEAQRVQRTNDSFMDVVVGASWAAGFAMLAFVRGGAFGDVVLYALGGFGLGVLIIDWWQQWWERQVAAEER